MSYLNWIEDEDFEEQVKILIKAFDSGKERALKDMGRNVMDPVLAFFNSGLLGGGVEEWEKRELSRQLDKTLSNAIGLFHQGILSKVYGWSCPPRERANFDLLNSKLKVIAEIKNKHNTVKASDKVGYYDDFKAQLDNKTSLYKGYTAYLVQIIPKHVGIFPFAPSDNKTGMRRAEHPFIKEIDGKSFYQLATGVNSALEDMINALPAVFYAVTDHQIPLKMIDRVSQLFADAYHQ
ncbi:MAG: Eco47II family restriction endonuclease [Akkermansia sp.]